MNKQLKKGVLDICVLHVLSTRDAYGYELLKELQNAMDVKESTVYPILTRLSKENLLTSYMAPSPDGPNRKYYKITETGTQEYQARKDEWLAFQTVITNFLN
ncbi:PadR family transcriptional regulator [Mollicutes bacterium LVI A0078]|nr:PadR family transcriptional regulator [Mollicutes bacterium LVI A0075]WOO90326.1 PadR family transcriptional regulator [Mollicutes bacterium LVI A0078]